MPVPVPISPAASLPGSPAALLPETGRPPLPRARLLPSPWAIFGAPNKPVSAAAETFKAKVEELFNGTMTAEIHGNSELGDAKEVAEQTTMNAIQARLISQGSLDQYDIRYALVTASYVCESYEHAYAVVDGPFAEWVSDGVPESKGLHNAGARDYTIRDLVVEIKELVTGSYKAPAME